MDGNSGREQSAQQRIQPRWHRWLPHGIVVALVLTLAAVIFWPSDGPDFEGAAEACSSPSIRVLDNGLSVTGAGGERVGASLDDIACVLDELEMPATVRERVANTRALDGMQEAEWEGVRASWTYHPDDGLSIIFEAN